MNTSKLGAMVLNPLSILNDGMLDCNWVKDPNEMGLGGIGRMLDGGAKGGLCCYIDGAFKHTRAKSFKIQANPAEGANDNAEQLFNIDGEDWAFTNFV